MTVAVMPEGPKDRWDRVGSIAFVVAAVIILALFVYSMLDAYVL